MRTAGEALVEWLKALRDLADVGFEYSFSASRSSALDAAKEFKVSNAFSVGSISHAC